jgi:hypothetical protein
MKHTLKDFAPVALACVVVALLAASTTATFGDEGASRIGVEKQKVVIPPAVPRAERGKPTNDVGARTIRTSYTYGARDVLPSGGAPAAVDSDCVPPPGMEGAIYRDSTTADRSVDACGVVHGGGGFAAPRTALASSVSIDRMTTTSGYARTHSIGETLVLFVSADTYALSNGTSWQSGAGSYYLKGSYLDHVEIDGATVRYVLRAPADGLMYQQTDYDSGDHSAQGSLGTTNVLVLEATIGSTTATIQGDATIVSNDATWYGDRFNYYSAVPGSSVPFKLTYTIHGTTWQPGTFDSPFSYDNVGIVDFSHPTSTPTISELMVRGSAQVPPNASVAYAAVVRYENGIERDVSGRASWQADPSSVAQISAGVLSTGTFAYDRQEISIRASYSIGSTTVERTKTIVGRLSTTVGDPESWPTYQADERHTGYVPLRYDPETFSLRWTKTLAAGYALNPVASAEGRVFASVIRYFGTGPGLFALDAHDGETLWSQEFGDPFSINPPAWGYGNVYIQTCNHSTDTWLHSFDAETGDRIFQAPLEAQWERYYAPTVYDGGVYVDGGYYGGMYALDAFSGTRRWFASLPQYDEWTPGVAGDYAYAYVGEYAPGLYVFDRRTGAEQAFIADPDFDWNGWSMNLAPLILENGDAVVIHNNRLIRFDVPGRRIAWQISSAYSGQPSYAHGVLYAIDNNRVVALSPSSGTELWSWTSPGGVPLSPLIVTDSHLFVSTSSTVNALDLFSRESVWSYPAGGSLALGDGNIYVAQQNGSLVAIAAAPVSPTPPVSLEIRGPDDATEFTSVQYHAFAHYADGRVRERTHNTTWSVTPTTYASIDENGVLAVREMLDMSQQIAMDAQYTEGGVTVAAAKPVELQVSVSPQQFIERNRLGASAIQLDVIARLADALARERAILRALGVPPESATASHPDPFVVAIVQAILAGEGASFLTHVAVDRLADAGTAP